MHLKSQPDGHRWVCAHYAIQVPIHTAHVLLLLSRHSIPALEGPGTLSIEPVCKDRRVTARNLDGGPNVIDRWMIMLGKAVGDT